MFRIFFLAIFCLAALNADAEWLWGRGSVGNNATGWPVATDHRGHVYMAAGTMGGVSFTDSALQAKIDGDLCVVTKYTSNGALLWSRSTGAGSHSYPISITCDSFGNCYLLGWLKDSTMQLGRATLRNSVFPLAQYFVVKYDSLGNVVYTFCDGGRRGALVAPPVKFDGTNEAKMQGLGSLVVDAESNVYVTTCFDLARVAVGTIQLSNHDNTGSTDDILLAKYDPNGKPVWAHSYGGRGDDIPYSMARSKRGGLLFLAGMFNSDTLSWGLTTLNGSGPGGWSAFVVMCDSEGTDLSGIGGGGSASYASGLAVDGTDRLVVTGGSADSIILFDSMIIYNPHPGKAFQYIVRMQKGCLPAYQAVIQSAGRRSVWGYSISAGADNIISVSGVFDSTISVGSSKFRLPDSSTHAIYVIAFSDYLYCMAGGTLRSGGVHQSGLAYEDSGHVYVCSDYENKGSDFPIGYYMLPDPGSNEHWAFLAKLHLTGASDTLPTGCFFWSRSRDTSVCLDDGPAVLPSRPGYISYTWCDSTTAHTLKVDTAGTYWVRCTDERGCSMADTIHVNEVEGLCNCKVSLPNAFTPNGDGVNDRFGAIFLPNCLLSQFELSIYDRWGQLVFHTTDPKTRWDGMYNSIEGELGTYMYAMKYRTRRNYAEHMKAGDVTLIR